MGVATFVKRHSKKIAKFGINKVGKLGIGGINIKNGTSLYLASKGKVNMGTVKAGSSVLKTSLKIVGKGITLGAKGIGSVARMASGVRKPGTGYGYGRSGFGSSGFGKKRKVRPNSFLGNLFQTYDSKQRDMEYKRRMKEQEEKRKEKNKDSKPEKDVYTQVSKASKSKSNGGLFKNVKKLFSPPTEYVEDIGDDYAEENLSLSDDDNFNKVIDNMYSHDIKNRETLEKFKIEYELIDKYIEENYESLFNEFSPYLNSSEFTKQMMFSSILENRLYNDNISYLTFDKFNARDEKLVLDLFEEYIKPYNFEENTEELFELFKSVYGFDSLKRCKCLSFSDSTNEQNIFMKRVETLFNQKIPEFQVHVINLNNTLNTDSNETNTETENNVETNLESSTPVTESDFRTILENIVNKISQNAKEIGYTDFSKIDLLEIIKTNYNDLVNHYEKHKQEENYEYTLFMHIDNNLPKNTETKLYVSDVMYEEFYSLIEKLIKESASDLNAKIPEEDIEALVEDINNTEEFLNSQSLIVDYKYFYTKNVIENYFNKIVEKNYTDIKDFVYMYVAELLMELNNIDIHKTLEDVRDSFVKKAQLEAKLELDSNLILNIIHQEFIAHKEDISKIILNNAISEEEKIYRVIENIENRNGGYLQKDTKIFKYKKQSNLAENDYFIAYVLKDYLEAMNEYEEGLYNLRTRDIGNLPQTVTEIVSKCLSIPFEDSNIFSYTETAENDGRKETILNMVKTVVEQNKEAINTFEERFKMLFTENYNQLLKIYDDLAIDKLKEIMDSNALKFNFKVNYNLTLNGLDDLVNNKDENAENLGLFELALTKLPYHVRFDSLNKEQLVYFTRSYFAHKLSVNSVADLPKMSQDLINSRMDYIDNLITRKHLTYTGKNIRDISLDSLFKQFVMQLDDLNDEELIDTLNNLNNLQKTSQLYTPQFVEHVKYTINVLGLKLNEKFSIRINNQDFNEKALAYLGEHKDFEKLSSVLSSKSSVEAQNSLLEILSYADVPVESQLNINKSDFSVVYNYIAKKSVLNMISKPEIGVLERQYRQNTAVFYYELKASTISKLVKISEENEVKSFLHFKNNDIFHNFETLLIKYLDSFYDEHYRSAYVKFRTAYNTAIEDKNYPKKLKNFTEIIPEINKSLRNHKFISENDGTFKVINSNKIITARVSPVHIQTTKNMLINSTFTIQGMLQELGAVLVSGKEDTKTVNNVLSMIYQSINLQGKR